MVSMMEVGRGKTSVIIENNSMASGLGPLNCLGYTSKHWHPFTPFKGISYPFKCCGPPRVRTCLPNKVLVLRESILQLADMMVSSGGWNLELKFSNWVSQQEWRQCLPPIFEFTVERVPWIIENGFLCPHKNERELASVILFYKSSQQQAVNIIDQNKHLFVGTFCNSSWGEHACSFSNGTRALGGVSTTWNSCFFLSFQIRRPLLQHVDRNASGSWTQCNPFSFAAHGHATGFRLGSTSMVPWFCNLLIFNVICVVVHNRLLTHTW